MPVQPGEVFAIYMEYQDDPKQGKRRPVVVGSF